MKKKKNLFLCKFWAVKTFRKVPMRIFFGRREKTPTPKTRFSIWTSLRTPGRFTTRPLPVYFTTKMSVVRPFSVIGKDEIGLSKTGRFLGKAEILGVGVFPPLSIFECPSDPQNLSSYSGSNMTKGQANPRNHVVLTWKQSFLSLLRGLVVSSRLTLPA